MSISWGKRERYQFVASGNLTTWLPPAQAAVYAITYKQDPKNKPKSHTVLYFGQGGDLSQEAPAYNSDVLDQWIHSGGETNDLYVFVHSMPGSTRWQRSSVQEQLVSEYCPDCNRY